MSGSIPRIAIVGRPNVGKSTLLNRLYGSRVSIVEPTAGVTRDRIAVRLEFEALETQRVVELMDTGGIGIVDRHDLGPHVEEQVRAAVTTAQVILFLVDVRDGVTPLDREVAERLRGLEVPVLLICNKAEGERMQWGVDEFRALGVGGEPVAISAQNGEGIEVLMERMVELLPPPSREEPGRLQPSIKLAVVGRRNAGKSTFVNAIARQERMIVSEIPGTTRDAVDVVLERDGHTVVVIDTAGVKKKSSYEDAIDFFSDTRSYRAVRRADVVLLMFDASQPIGGLDKRLARYVVDHHKPLILGANKWDLCRDRMEPESLENYLQAQLPGISWAPVSFLSAKSRWHVDATFELAQELFEQASVRVGTGELNRVLESALQSRSPSSRGHRVQIKYATQVEGRPPRIVLFVNDRRLIGKDYLRYLENRLRAALPFKDVPMHLVLRDKSDDLIPEEA
ncbi:MAG: ribosome biogenesis GTPase Der [Planctomycetota bacterium]